MRLSIVKAILVLLSIVSFSRHGYTQEMTAAEQNLTKEKILSMFIRINAPVDSVWSRFADAKGIKKFFAPDCNYELKTLGKLDILFAPQAPAGQRGAENNVIMSVQEKKMISFSWDAPPQYPEIRKNRTLVAIRFFATGPKETIVTLSQTGWGQGDDWNTVYDYFTKAWSGFVLPNLKYSLEVAAINWKDFPKNLPQNLTPAQIIKL